MPRKIKGWNHIGHFTEAGFMNSWDMYRLIKLLVGLYGKENIKVIENSYMGHWYADIYLKKNAKKRAKLVAMFGSTMTFKDLQTGKLYGDNIQISKSSKE